MDVKYANLIAIGVVVFFFVLPMGFEFFLLNWNQIEWVSIPEALKYVRSFH